MKRYLLTLLLAALSAGVFLACNDDDDDGGDPTGSNGNNPSAAFQVTVDGTQRVYTANSYQSQFDSSGVWVHIIAGNAGDGTNISLTILNDTETLAVQTYTGSTIVVTVSEGSAIGDTYASNVTSPADAEIEITAATATQVSGTFSGTLTSFNLDGSSATRVLTDGSFSDIGQ